MVSLALMKYELLFANAVFLSDLTEDHYFMTGDILTKFLLKYLVLNIVIFNIFKIILLYVAKLVLTYMFPSGFVFVVFFFFF